MQELTFEQVESVSGGAIEMCPNPDIKDPHWTEDNNNMFSTIFRGASFGCMAAAIGGAKGCLAGALVMGLAALSQYEGNK
jgi:hypothetical protein